MSLVLPFKNWIRENEEQTYDQIEQRDLALFSKSQYFYPSRTPDFSAEWSSGEGIKKKARLFRMASSCQSFSSGFSTTRLSNNRSSCFLPMLSTSSIYSLTSRSFQLGNRCNDTKLEHMSSLCIPPFQYDFKSAPKK